MIKNWQKIKSDPNLIKTFLMREKVIDAIRFFFKNQGFHEVETPLLVKSPGTEPFLEVFETELKIAHPSLDNSLSQYKFQPAFLLTSPEYAMKKLVAGGLGNIFQICKSFRNGEGLSQRHNPEFTILEWYRENADYMDIMSDFELMFLAIFESVLDSEKLEFTYQGRQFDLTRPFPRLSVFEAFKKYIGLQNEDQLLSRDYLVKKCQSFDYQIDEETTWEEAYNQLFLNLIEPELAKIDKPVFIYDYPASQGALARKKTSDPRFAERFEVYLGGLELGNAFSELIDGREQKERFEEELALRKTLGKTEYDLDQDYIDALNSGMPETGGIAVGIDRLVMIFADVESIEEVVFFPAQEVFE